MQTLSLSAAESFEEVMELYMPMVYRIALSRLGDRSEAEDITQEVFLRYFRTRHDLQQRGAPEGVAYPVYGKLRDKFRHVSVEPPPGVRRNAGEFRRGR